MATDNWLGQAVSPYLLQHKDNPVAWREWSDTAMDEARQRDRPILLSIGYAACHWCHVMAHESFEDEEVAKVMNRLFVNIKVDREERPDVDHLYMTALQAMGEQGGWPMTMFLTPEGRPFWGGTYFPKERQYGRPGFVELLLAISKAWDERRAELTASAGAISDRLESFLSRSAGPGPLEAAALAPAAERIAGMMDHRRGGMRGAPKFPNAPFMEVLARSAFPDGPIDHREAFLTTLRALCQGGIYDHLGGGLHRYSVDDRWLVPHFEKMLYDNAQFLRHLNWGWRATADELFRVRIEQTVGWLEREMRVPGGGFAASLDADSPDEHGHPEEGAYYVWQEAEIDEVLGEAGAAFKTAYDVGTPGNWEGKTILNRLACPQDAAPDPFAAERGRLLARRDARARPGRDDKVLADWNGLVIRALAEISHSTGLEEPLRLARGAFAFVLENMRPEGRLHHAAREGRVAGLALSSDYGALISAAVALFAATLDGVYLERASDLADELERWHSDGEGGHYLTASDAGDVLIRLRGDHDDAVPSGTAQVLEGLALLAQASGSMILAARARRATELAVGRVGAGAAAGAPGIVSAVDRLVRGSELAVLGRPADPARWEMVSAANRCLDLNRLDLFADEVGRLPEALPLSAVQPARLPAAFVCNDRSCKPPVYEPESLLPLLGGSVRAT